ncbi:glycosyltransferase family 2 protein [Gordonia sp. CPCC 205515]|uniref:glycosyltransferase family 2 protein n=1 Tax=Gordonia sp. CPCC 205515 TaxID=3140791 RepID=UPI003AF376EF
MTHLRISVVIPVYRSEDFIRDCLQAVLDQHRPVDEIILVDDCGGDASLDIASDVLAHAPVNHLVVRQSRNTGVGSARNAGAAAATGDLVWFLDSDDLADPTFTAIMGAAFEHTDADLAACRTDLVDATGDSLHVVEPSPSESRLSGTQFVQLLLTGEVKAYPGGHVFRRSVLGAAPWAERRAYEDMVATAHMALRSRSVAMIDAPLYRYRQRAGSISHTVNANTPLLFDMGDEMVAVIAQVAEGGRQRRLARRFEYREVLIPAAHMAMRAAHAGDGANPVVAELLASSRMRASIRDMLPLLADRQVRSAVFALGMTVSPDLYSSILRRRPEPVRLA